MVLDCIQALNVCLILILA